MIIEFKQTEIMKAGKVCKGFNFVEIWDNIFINDKDKFNLNSKFYYKNVYLKFIGYSFNFLGKCIKIKFNSNEKIKTIEVKMKYYDSKGHEIEILQTDGGHEEAFILEAQYVDPNLDCEVSENELDYLTDKYFEQISMMEYEKLISQAENYYEGDR